MAAASSYRCSPIAREACAARARLSPCANAGSVRRRQQHDREKPSAEHHRRQDTTRLVLKKKRPEGLSPSGLRTEASTRRVVRTGTAVRAVSCAGSTVDGADPHEVRISEARDGIAPPHMIQHVARCHPELDSIVANREAAEHAHIQVVVHRAAEEVPAGVAPLVARLSERGRIVVHGIGSCRPDLSNLCDLLDRLLSRALIQRGVIPIYRERVAGVDLVDAVDLPVLDNRWQDASSRSSQTANRYRKPIEKLWVLS